MKKMVDGVEHNYRTDEHLQTILGRSGTGVPHQPLEQTRSLAAKLQTAIALVDDPVRSEQLKKIRAGFEVPPIKEPALTAHSTLAETIARQESLRNPSKPRPFRSRASKSARVGIRGLKSVSLLGLAIDRLVQFVVQCARDDPAFLSRSNLDAVGTASPPRRRPIVAAVGVAGLLAASAAIALYGYDHPGVQLTGFAAAAEGSRDSLTRAGRPPAETQSAAVVTGDLPPVPAADGAALVAAPANPALRPIAIRRVESPAAKANRGTRTGELPAAALREEVAGEPLAETLRRETPTKVALLSEALAHAARAVAPETLPQAAPAVAPPAEALRQGGPDVTPATLHKPAGAGEAHLPVAVHSTRLPRRHVIYHTYRQPARFVDYRYYYPPSPAAILAQFATNVGRKFDAIFR